MIRPMTAMTAPNPISVVLLRAIFPCGELVGMVGNMRFHPHGLPAAHHGHHGEKSNANNAEENEDDRRELRVGRAVSGSHRDTATSLTITRAAPTASEPPASSSMRSMLTFASSPSFPFLLIL